MPSKPRFTEHELEAYLDDALAPSDLAAIEAALRSDPQLLDQVAAINGRRNSGIHTVGEIWRRHRLSCASREQLGRLLLGALSDEEADYIRFHIQTIGCRFCEANLADLQRRQAESTEQATSRRSKYFQTSAGLLRKKKS